MIIAIRNLRRLHRCTKAVVAVETALVLSIFLVPMLLCLLDFATLFQGQAAVDEAMQDAMTYVLNVGVKATTAGVQTAAQASTSQTISVSTSTVCYCVSTTSSSPTMPDTVACNSTCGNGYVFQQFMNIVTTGQVAIPMPVPWINLNSPYTATATGMVRTG
jgi:Flp pilus assembly protein TadG